MDALRIIASLVVPWVLGIAVLLVVLPRPRDGVSAGEPVWLLGAGYTVGAFLLTCWMRALSLAHVRFGALVVAAPIVAAAAVLLWVRHRRYGADGLGHFGRMVRTLRTPSPDRLLRIVWWLLIAWMAVRFVLLGIEITLRPLYPWDAWIQWATKARVWYALGYMAPFGRADAWLSANGALYFDASPEYPPTMPLLQVWTCLMLGRWDDSLMNWPWWMLLLSLVLAIYGALQRLGVGAWSSLVAAMLAATLPLADVHVALAGYADMPMAVYYTIAVLALLRWNMTRTTSDALAAILLAIACTQIKNPGIVWALTLVPGLIVILLPQKGVRVVAALFGLAVLGLAVLAQTEPVIFNYRLHLDFNPAWAALGETLFLLDNWHLLWYAVIAVAIVAWRQLLSPALVPVTMIGAAGVLFLFVVFGFTNARIWVSDQTTINRAVLHFAPVALVFAVLAFDAFARRWWSRHAPPPASPEIVSEPQAAA